MRAKIYTFCFCSPWPAQIQEHQKTWLPCTHTYPKSMKQRIVGLKFSLPKIKDHLAKLDLYKHWFNLFSINHITPFYCCYVNIDLTHKKSDFFLLIAILTYDPTATANWSNEPKPTIKSFSLINFLSPSILMLFICAWLLNETMTRQCPKFAEQQFPVIFGKWGKRECLD